jgi:cleavage stimulation factor subunit 2
MITTFQTFLSNVNPVSMAQTREKGGRVVFIGNIPYGVSEEQIVEIFGRVGNTVSFRLVYDKETGKPKGFGFLEYTDVDAAASAVRNLNGFQLQGRELKVDYSNDNSANKNQNQNQSDQQGSGRAPPPAHFNVDVSARPPQQQQMNGMPQQGGGLLPPLPPGMDLPPNLQAPDAISKTLSAMPAEQLLDVLSQFKNLAAAEPQKATALLSQAPQLSYAIFQALILLGLVDPNILTSLLQQPPPAQQPQAPPQPQQPPMPTYPAYGQPPPQQAQYVPPPQHQQPVYPPYGQPPQQHPGYVPTPPQPQPQWQPPPQQQAYQAPPQPQAQVPPDQQQLVDTIMAMSPEQIFALDPVARDQIMQLRQLYGRPVS